MRSLRSQLISSHMLLVFIMSLVMGGAIWQFFIISRSVEMILQENFQSVIAAQEMDSALHQQEVAYLELLDGDLMSARQTYFDARNDFERAITQASSTTTEPDEMGVLLDLSEKAKRLRILSGPIFDPNLLTVQPGTRSLLKETIRPSLADMRKDTQRLRQINERQVILSYESAQGQAERSSWRSVATTAGALILAVLLGLQTVQRALTPLRKFQRRIERVASGDFQGGIKVTGPEEVRALAHSFDLMEAKLVEMRRVEARRLQRAEQMSDTALESLYDPVVVTDAHARIVYLNKAAQGLFGETSFQDRKPVGEHIPDRRIVRAIQNAIEERVSDSEDEAAHIPLSVGERERFYRLRATPMKDEAGQLLGSVTVLEDITHLREVDRLKTEFIGVASHELRTPVTSLILANQLLLEGAVGDLGELQREVVEAQQKDLSRLEKLMRDLLDVTRLEAGSAPPRMELLTPHEIAEGPLGTLRPQAERKGVELRVDVPLNLPRVRGDRTQLGRVLTNLVANAIRHTNSGGVVSVTASWAADKVSFRIEDTGEGIPKTYLDQIFERFVQVPGATQGGAGLGLSIAQNIVRTHGGEMTVESEVGRGSVFSFTLPVESQVSGGQVA